MNEDAKTIGQTLDRITALARRYPRARRWLRAQLKEIGEDIERRRSEHQVSARHLKRGRNGRGDANPYEYSINVPSRTACRETGGSYRAEEPWR